MASPLLTTRTEDTGFFDQIHGLSQHAVNDYLKTLFDADPQHARLYYKDKPTNSELKGLLDAPRVVFDVDKTLTLKVLFQIRFNTVDIRFNDSDTQNMNGWVIAASATLPQSTVKAEDATASTIKPGDYSVHRLLGAFSANTWSAPDLDGSICIGKEKQITSYREWKADKQNSKLAILVENVLRRWANLHVEKRFFAFTPNNIGIPDVPAVLQLQLARYRAPSGSTLDNAAQSLYNSIVFCEMFSPHAMPEKAHLKLEDNFASTESGSGQRLLGSSVIDHRTFLEGHLLPRLGELCAISRLVPLMPHQSTPSPNEHLLISRCCVGGDPEIQGDTQFEQQIQENAGYEFEYIKPRLYRWTRTFSAPGNDMQVLTYDGDLTGKLYRKYDISAKSSAEVKWDTGSDLVVFSSVVEYNHCDAWRKGDANFSCLDTNICVSWSYKRVIHWSVKIRLYTSSNMATIPNGMIVPVIESINSDTGLPDDYQDTRNRASARLFSQSFTKILKLKLNTVLYRPRTLDGITCDFCTSLADRHMPRLQWYVMTWEYKPDTKQIGFLVFADASTDLFLGLKAKIGLAGSYASISNVKNHYDDPLEYNDGTRAWTVEETPDTFTVFQKGISPQDGFPTSDLSLAFIVDLSGKVVGYEPLVVEVEEVWNCKNNAGKQVGLYASSFFEVVLDSDANMDGKIDAKPMSWGAAVALMKYKEPEPPSWV
ncbi:hypothetical protein FBEOM_12542 [Fusarium beomiforme]|uniref:Uncharacterized protein n=1 Tax=Fusarium beomiforme TaxID=44412 RepID=A0A9P5DPJ2_9HYPO|nr:hypothetical protein FBEOM_12542 [Fusarium beomiforme]